VPFKVTILLGIRKNKKLGKISRFTVIQNYVLVLGVLDNRGLSSSADCITLIKFGPTHSLDDRTNSGAKSLFKCGDNLFWVSCLADKESNAGQATLALQEVLDVQGLAGEINLVLKSLKVSEKENI
jgi:hypothetical protein